jgi:hypothetical protein
LRKIEGNRDARQTCFEQEVIDEDLEVEKRGEGKGEKFWSATAATRRDRVFFLARLA